MKYEWRKNEKNLFGAKKNPALINIPDQQFIMIKGQGNPNEKDFSDRVTALYSLAYGIKMLYKKNFADNAEYTDFTVFPLQGIWGLTGKVEKQLDKSKLKYTIMIKQPDFITKKMVDLAIESVKKKKSNRLYDKVSFDVIKGNKAVQILHIGSFDSEPASFKMMDKFIQNQNLNRKGDCHTEIYLSNKNRTAEDRLKTILRYNVE